VWEREEGGGGRGDIDRPDVATRLGLGLTARLLEEEGGGGIENPDEGFGRRGGTVDEVVDDDDMIATVGRLFVAFLFIGTDG